MSPSFILSRTDQLNDCSIHTDNCAIVNEEFARLWGTGIFNMIKSPDYTGIKMQLSRCPGVMLSQESPAPCSLRHLQVKPQDSFQLYDQWIINEDGTIESGLEATCSEYAISVADPALESENVLKILKLSPKQASNPEQQFTVKTDEIILRPNVGKDTQVWQFHSSHPPYDFAVLPGESKSYH